MVAGALTIGICSSIDIVFVLFFLFWFWHSRHCRYRRPVTSRRQNVAMTIAVCKFKHREACRRQVTINTLLHPMTRVRCM
ncbi:hypothetical protein GGR56DRAFT_634823 [Xylariaceae sp. FL0804]|nr:hypothetical protein GGR56DRAFT_634823 [Xylariaceae sp. FL0804]